MKHLIWVFMVCFLASGTAFGRVDTVQLKVWKPDEVPWETVKYAQPSKKSNRAISTFREGESSKITTSELIATLRQKYPSSREALTNLLASYRNLVLRLETNELKTYEETANYWNEFYEAFKKLEQSNSSAAMQMRLVLDLHYKNDLYGTTNNLYKLYLQDIHKMSSMDWSYWKEGGNQEIRFFFNCFNDQATAKCEEFFKESK